MWLIAHTTSENHICQCTPTAGAVSANVFVLLLACWAFSNPPPAAGSFATDEESGTLFNEIGFNLMPHTRDSVHRRSMCNTYVKPDRYIPVRSSLEGGDIFRINVATCDGAPVWGGGITPRLHTPGDLTIEVGFSSTRGWVALHTPCVFAHCPSKSLL